PESDTVLLIVGCLCCASQKCHQISDSILYGRSLHLPSLEILTATLAMPTHSSSNCHRPVVVETHPRLAPVHPFACCFIHRHPATQAGSRVFKIYITEGTDLILSRIGHGQVHCVRQYFSSIIAAKSLAQA